MTQPLALHTAPRPNSPTWKPEPLAGWPEFVGWLDLDNPVTTSKESGGYVLGSLEGNRRSRDTVISRSGVTLDIDNADDGTVAAVVALFPDTAYVLHSTWRHRVNGYGSRYRLIMPLSRDVGPAEYELITRALSDSLGADAVDAGSCQPERFMYRPATQDLAAYECYRHEGSPLDPETWVSAGAALPRDKGNVPQLGPADFEVGSTPTEAQVLKAQAVLAKAVTEIRSGSTINQQTGEIIQGRDNSCIRWLPILYQFVQGGCLDRELVDTRVWDATQDAPSVEPYERAEFERVARSAWGYATDDGPVRPDVPADFTPADGDRPGVDVTDDVAALNWLTHELGREGTPLSGFFQQGDDLVFSPRIGQEGYREGFDGARTFVRLAPGGITSIVGHEYKVTALRGRGDDKVRRPVLFPLNVGARIEKTPVFMLPSVRQVSGLTVTPLVRRDGTLLSRPGYDAATGLVYLPDALSVPRVRGRADAAEARALLDDLVADFPWKTPGDRANYLAGMLTPLLRQIAPPPYKMLVISAPQSGSGKSLLGQLLREIHGGVFTAEFPRDSDELRKVVTSLLDQSGEPVIQFDNVSGMLRSAVLDGLLTSSVWSARRLGVNETVRATNDRLWVATGNNLAIGGDLARRVLWSVIDADMERPENRTTFRHADLIGYARENRGRILWALLTLIVAWHEDGARVQLNTGDGFAYWQSVCSSVLGESVGAPAAEVVQYTSSDEESEWAEFLTEIVEVFGTAPFRPRDVSERLNVSGLPMTTRQFRRESLPEALAEKLARRMPIEKSLGRWLANRKDRWTDNRCIRHVRRAADGNYWRVETR